MRNLKDSRFPPRHSQDATNAGSSCLLTLRNNLQTGDFENWNLKIEITDLQDQTAVLGRLNIQATNIDTM
jgi:hypothetical protein